jgi:hypothetical protein
MYVRSRFIIPSAAVPSGPHPGRPLPGEPKRHIIADCRDLRNAKFAASEPTVERSTLDTLLLGGFA